MVDALVYHALAVSHTLASLPPAPHACDDARAPRTSLAPSEALSSLFVSTVRLYGSAGVAPLFLFSASLPLVYYYFEIRSLLKLTPHRLTTTAPPHRAYPTRRRHPTRASPTRARRAASPRSLTPCPAAGYTQIDPYSDRPCPPSSPPLPPQPRAPLGSRDSRCTPTPL